MQPGITAVEAETDADNEASKRVLSKLGFAPTGQFGDEGPRFVLRNDVIGQYSQLIVGDK